jgi:hypothetical protein
MRNDIGQMIEDAADDDFDRLVLAVARSLHDELGDDAPSWLLERVRGAADKGLRKKCSTILSGIGYWSDGFTDEMMDEVLRDLTDAATEEHTRSDLALAALQHEVWYRPDSVFQKMGAICDFVIAHQELFCGRAGVSGVAADCCTWLDRRKNVFAGWRDGRYIVDEEVLGSLVAGGSTAAKRFQSFGFSADNVSLLRSALLVTNTRVERAPPKFFGDASYVGTDAYEIHDPFPSPSAATGPWRREFAVLCAIWVPIGHDRTKLDSVWLEGRAGWGRLRAHEG